MKKKSTVATAFGYVASKKFSLLFSLLMIGIFSTAQQKTIQLYDGVAPGSENWNWEEKETINQISKMKVVYNVVKPTLTIFFPESPNGTGIITCPANLLGLNFEHEGINLARELNKKGFTVFVLKNRVVRLVTDDPWQEILKILRDTTLYREKTAGVRNLAFDDLKTAMIHVRKNANEYKVAPNKIGVVGFSGSANTLVSRLAQFGEPETRPDFVGFIYAGRVTTENIQATSPPAFIASAGDDSLATSSSIKVFTAWRAAGVPAELHIYSKGGHGLRFAPGNTWKDRFGDWIKNEGF
jgi:predicted esterase